jgi:hypothetical protein
MKEAYRTFCCETGDMYLSERMADLLSEHYGNNHQRSIID